MTRIAMKVFDLQWFMTFGMDYARAASELTDDSVNMVITQNQIDPLPSSGVDQSAYLQADGGRAATYRDRAFTEALRVRGVEVLQTTALFFDPDLVARFPDARPVDAAGQEEQGFDWYSGVCPTHERYLDAKIERLVRVAESLEPDGFLLQFTRFPGFWENWTWNPDYRFSERDQFCFCHRCLERFSTQRRISFVSADSAIQRASILRDYSVEWTAWRCERLLAAIERVVAACRAILPDMTFMLNTLPFPADDFDGSDVRRTIAAQDLSLLSSTIDRFELMTYLQILNRPADWAGEAVRDARRLIPSGREIFATLQASPLYTDGVHAGRGRATTVSSADLRAAAKFALESGADGLAFYHWTDFLEDDRAGGNKRTVLREIAHG